MQPTKVPTMLQMMFVSQAECYDVKASNQYILYWQNFVNTPSVDLVPLLL